MAFCLPILNSFPMMSLWPLLLMKRIAQLLGEFELVEECAK